jgi:hypothetical protein
MFAALRGRRWVLAANAAVVHTRNPADKSTPGKTVSRLPGVPALDATRACVTLLVTDTLFRSSFVQRRWRTHSQPQAWALLRTSM